MNYSYLFPRSIHERLGDLDLNKRGASGGVANGNQHDQQDEQRDDEEQIISPSRRGLTNPNTDSTLGNILGNREDSSD